jgi:NAD+ synthase
MNINNIRSVLTDHLRRSLKLLHRTGYVIGLSGGIDSTVTAHLAAEAVGPERVYGVIMPEVESSPESQDYALELASKLGIRCSVIDITEHLKAVEAYSLRDNVVKSQFKDYAPKMHKVGISLRQNLTDSFLPPLHYLIVCDDKDNLLFEKRLNQKDYAALVAATNFKQRARALQLYYIADRENYAVLGTTNRDELLLGFFVKLGDGAADVEALDVLYKSEVYQLAQELDVDPRVIDRTPTTDTLPGQPSQRDYFYGVDFPTIDQALLVMEGVRSIEDAAATTGLNRNEIEVLVHNLRRRKSTTTILRSYPLSIDRASVLA